MALFTVIERNALLPQKGVRQAFLIKNNWDDWFKYETLFKLIVFDESGAKSEPGEVKIGVAGLKPGGTIAAGTRAPSFRTSSMLSLITTFRLARERPITKR
jgi:hypothetical protein